MFNRILVTLDGSELAERALRPAFELADKFSSVVVLLRVAVPSDVPVMALPGMGGLYYDVQQADDTRAHEEAAGYLYSQRAEWLGIAQSVQTEVITGTPAEVILDVAQAKRIDLIVMSTHGRSGLSRLLYGSVAEGVLHGARIPVLLIPSKM